MGFIFIKMIKGETVSSNGSMVFKKLTTAQHRGQIDLSTLGLTTGTYEITVTSSFSGLVSEPSNTVIYTVK